jgi:SPOC domain
MMKFQRDLHQVIDRILCNYLAIVLFSPSNETFLNLFTEYLKYFNDKQRAGVIQLKKSTLYLVPPNEETFKIHPFKPTEFLGVFVDMNELQKGTGR